MDIALLEELLEVQNAVAEIALAMAAHAETPEADEAAIEAQRNADNTAMTIHRARVAQGEQHA